MCEESSDSDAYVSADESLGYEAETKEAPTASSQTHLHDDGQIDKSPGKGEMEMKSAKDVQSYQDGDDKEIIISCSLEEGGVTTSAVKNGEGEAKDVGMSQVQGGDVKVQQEPGGQRDGDSPVPTSPDESSGGQAALLGGEEERAPVPPPRRKRKKQRMQKQSSLDELELLSTPFQRSLTVGSSDLSREKTGGRLPSGPSGSDGSSERASIQKARSASPDLEQTSQGVSLSPLLRTVPPGPDQQQFRDTLAATSKEVMPSDGATAADYSDSFPSPAISIEPNTSLELTAEMLGNGESEVITTDAPLTRACSTTNANVGVIITSDDESLDGDAVFGGEEFVGVTGEELEGEGGEEEEEEEEESCDGGKERGKQHRSKATGVVKSKHSSSPSDNQILEMTMVKNLDTGEVIPLSAADERIPRGWGLSPLSEHLIRRTNELAGRDVLSHSMDEDELEESQRRRKSHLRKKLKLKPFWGKWRESRQLHEMPPLDDVDKEHDTVKYKPSSHYKGPLEFERVRLKQDLTGVHLGAVWVMEFSICGRLLATAGQDSVVRVWVLRTASQFFNELQAKYQRLGVHSSGESLSEKASMVSVASTGSSRSSEEDDSNVSRQPFMEQPLCSYYGHTADVLDLSWSKNFFLLSSSMDKTVRLWHISRKECLCCFQHVDFVTAIAFHPRDDRYFLSGSLDGKLRLWNIPDKRVALWNEIESVGSRLITTANFCMNGKLAVAGTYDGRCIFYETEHLKYHTQIHVRSRHGKNRGRKISGVEPLPGEDKLLVTSNDSRLRLYNLKDHSLSCKYKGGLNTSSQIKATFSQDGQYIIGGSEDNYVYIWKTHHDVSKLSSARRDRNEYYESFSAHSAPVTSAIFAPVPGITVDEGLKEVGQMIVAADYQGCIKIYVNSEQL